MNSQSAYESESVESCTIDDIAWELLFNYLMVSFPNASIKSEAIKNILSESALKGLSKVLESQGLSNIEDKGKVRNIFIFGTGASHNVYNKIPLGDEAIDSLAVEFLGKPKGRKKKSIDTHVDEQINKLTQKIEKSRSTEKSKLNKAFLYHLLSYRSTRKKFESIYKKLSFEEHLSIFSNVISPESVRKALKKEVDFRFLPSLLYEITAHLFKHRFIDAIVNFNFDELLDQAILEELANSDYKRVISDGDCTGIEELIVEDRFKIPVYIKPHGTVGHENTMRFTKDHYVDIPEGMEKLLSELVSGYIKTNDKGTIQRVDRVNIFCIGFAMASVEFNYILNNNLTLCNKSHIYFFGKKGDIEKKLSDIVNADLVTGNTIEKKLLEVSYKPGAFNNEFKVLFDNIHSKLSKPFKVRSIYRHELIHKLFYDIKKDLSYYESSIYYFDRFVIEVAITLLNNGGFIEPFQLKEDRTTMYYELYREKKKAEEKKKTLTVYDVLYDIFELKENFSFASHLFNISEDRIDNIPQYLIDKIIRAKDYVSKDLKRNLINNKNKVLDKFRHLELKYIYELAPSFTKQTRTIFGTFDSTSVIHTNLGFVYQIWEMFTVKQLEWNTILLTTEKAKLIGTLLKELKDLAKTGNTQYSNLLKNNIVFRIIMRYESAIMAKKQTSKPSKKIKNPQSEYVSYEDIDEILDDDLKARTRYVPYWLQNDHFIMFINNNGEKTEFIRSIYFEKEGYSRKINPVAFEKDCEEDHKMLLQYFMQYWLKGSAELDSHNQGEFNMKTYKNLGYLCKAFYKDSEVNDPDLDQVIKNIFPKPTSY